jgi:hypothetical protein
MSKVTKIAAALAVVPMLAFASPVFADSPGQLSNGTTNYKVRNVTKDGAYAQAISAACNETVKYSVTAANSDFGLLKDVTVKANLASGDINISAKNVNGDTTSVSGKATVSVPSNGTLSYISGSTVRINSSNTSTTKQGDGVVTANGVNVGDLNGSTYIFVQFQAKVTCETEEQPKDIKVCRLSDKKVVTIKESEYNADKYSKDLSKCDETPVTPPKELANTGAGQVVAIAAGAVAAGTVGARLFLSRRLARQ